MKNVLVWGNGFIASHLKYEKIKERAIINSQNIREILKLHKPDVLINCIGYCGEKNIDNCLDNKEKTIVANTVIPIIIANECDKLGIQFIHIGSGCIFSKLSPHTKCLECNLRKDSLSFIDDKEDYYSHLSYCTGKIPVVDDGWRETDLPNPVSFYSETKAACDFAIKSLPNVCILRIRMPISDKNSSRNFISKIRNYKQVIDIANSATFVDDLTRCIDWTIDNKKSGIYNVVNPEPITAAQVMKEYQKYIPDHTFEIITGEQLDKLTKSKRSNCLIDGSKLKNEGFIMRPTKEALEETMKKYIENMKENNNE